MRDCLIEISKWDEEIFPLLFEKEVFILLGEKDESIPCFVGEHLQEKLPNATFEIIKGENHSMIRRKWRDVLQLSCISTPSNI